MNLMLFHASELQPDHTVRLTATDRRAEHVTQVLGSQPGDQLKAGIINGLTGTALLQTITADSLLFFVRVDTEPPPALDLTLILALPRPKMMRRIVQCVASMGVKDVIFINSSKVEKSYWQTPWLSAESLYEQSLLGLEQAIDTRLPEIRQFKLFKPFAEDHLPQICAGKNAWFAHPGSTAGVPEISARSILAIGPEGGFTAYESNKMESAGMQGFQFGKRILRMETAIPALLGRLFF